MGKDKKTAAGIEPVEPRWLDLVVLCKKCIGKQDGEGAEDLRSDLRRALKKSGHRKDVRIVEGPCMGVCPKGGVTVCWAARLSGPARVGVVGPPYKGEALARWLGYED